MRVVVLALTIVLAPAVALAGTGIVAACYKDCENATHSNPQYKACLARAADKAEGRTQPGLQNIAGQDPRRGQGHGAARRHPS